MTYSRCDFAENHDSIVKNSNVCPFFQISTPRMTKNTAVTSTNSHVCPFRSVHLMDRQHEKGPDRMNTIGTFRDIMRVL
mgnify:CR=1 FL=1